MPCVRGVDVSIITQPGSKKLPEFPHSDASSVRILPPGNHRSNLSETVSVSSAPDSPRIQKVNPRISVYVPSVPGAQFGVHYSLTRMPEPPCHVYFKIFMNGRNVTNCGTNPALQASGSITRALCEPSERWHYKENGMIHKREGIESRCFYFLPNSSKTSVAEDGGLIEVQAFRAQGRKRRAPILGKHRDQESYGIATPSAGLVESLEDACYYDWILIDPKEYPFVSFHFHYRSWSNLRQLNLAPAFSELKEPALQVGDSFPGTSSNSAALCNGVIGNELIEASPIKIEYASDRRQVYQEEELSHFEQHRPPSGRHSAAEAPEVARIRVSARPLPEVPLKKPSVKKSCESFARSITPSLLPYIEEEPTEVEEVEFGTVTKIAARSDPLRDKRLQPPVLDGLQGSVDTWPLSRERTRPSSRGSLIIPVKQADLFQGQSLRSSVDGKDNRRRQKHLRPMTEAVSILMEKELTSKTEWTMSEELSRIIEAAQRLNWSTSKLKTIPNHFQTCKHFKGVVGMVFSELPISQFTAKKPLVDWVTHWRIVTGSWQLLQSLPAALFQTNGAHSSKYSAAVVERYARETKGRQTTKHQHHTDATAMADSGWLRILGANRSRTHGLSSPRSEPALQDLLKSSHGSTEMQTHHERKSMTRLVSCQGSALAEQVTSSFAPELAFDEVDKLFINAGQQVWHSPSIDQVAEALRVGVMTNPSQEPLPVEYRPYILYLVEGYGTIHQKVTKLEAEVAGAKYQLDKESERHAAVEERWMVQEARYKAEIKRLELIIHDISGESLEAVVLARAGSLVRGRTKVPAEQKERPVDDAVDDSSVRSSRANTATQDEDTDRPSPPSLKSQQGTILSRRRTMDTSNEVRLSRRFRKLDNIVQKPDTHGTRRVKKQEAVRGKTHEEQDRTAQPSRRDTSSLSGSKSSGAVGEPPLKGNEEKKRDSAEMPASKDTVHGPCSRSAAAESKSMHDGQQTYGHHRRQFSFVPGDDRAAVRPTETMAPRSTAAVAQVGQQLPVLGRHPNRCPGKNWRSRSAEWIGMGEGLRPITTDTHGATEMGDGPRK
ncbi:hypothetical protein ACJZ2D_010502 [Fusarium nematophilum]